VPPLSSTFQMHPGEGVYVYPWAPHWVENGPEVSVSLSITFRTGLSERQERVHRFNAKLRRNGLAPVAPGVSDGLDRMKAGTIGLVGWLRRAGRRQRGARDYS